MIDNNDSFNNVIMLIYVDNSSFLFLISVSHLFILSHLLISFDLT